jgi:hypothetical protein
MILPLIPFIMKIESYYEMESLTLRANIFESKYLYIILSPENDVGKKY